MPLHWAFFWAAIWAAAAGAQTLSVVEDDDYLLIEFDRYSLKIARRDPTPLLRIYASGRVLIYRSGFKPDAGVYELLLEPGELDDLVNEIVAGGLDEVGSVALAENAERAAIHRQQATGTLYYSSDSTITQLSVNLPNRTRNEPLLFENLNDAATRHPDLAYVANLARLQDLLLEIAGRTSRKRVGEPRSLDKLD